MKKTAAIFNFILDLFLVFGSLINIVRGKSDFFDYFYFYGLLCFGIFDFVRCVRKHKKANPESDCVDTDS